MIPDNLPMKYPNIVLVTYRSAMLQYAATSWQNCTFVRCTSMPAVHTVVTW